MLSANRVQKFGLSTIGRGQESSILDSLVDVMVKVSVETLKRLLTK